MRKGKHRLVYYPRGMFAKEYPDGFGELYDLEQDPWEMKNLYFDDASRPVIAELEHDLLEWLVTTTRNRSVSPTYAHPEQGVERYHIVTNADGKLPWQHVCTKAGGAYT